jgi:hypothetical protein
MNEKPITKEFLTPSLLGFYPHIMMEQRKRRKNEHVRGYSPMGSLVTNCSPTQEKTITFIAPLKQKI